MTNYNALVVKSGGSAQIHSTDNLNIGAGILNEAGALNVNGVTGATLQVNGTTQFSIAATGATLTQPVATSGSPIALAVTTAAHTTLANAELVDVSVDLSASAQVTTGATIANMRAFRILGRTYTATAATQTISAAATLSISAPTAGTNVTFTALANALNLESGNLQMASSTSLAFSGAGGTIIASAPGGALTYIGNNVAASAAPDHIIRTKVTRTNGNLVAIQNLTTNRILVNYDGGIVMTQGAAASGTVQMLSLTGGAHTGQTASTEINFVNVAQGTVTWAAGAITTQRSYLLQAPTIAFASGSNAVTTAATLAIDKAPVAGTNCSGITNPYAFWVQAGTSQFDARLTSNADYYWTGTITPTALAADANDYAPTGFATATVIRQDGGAANRNITGLAGGVAGKMVVLANIGTSNNLILNDSNAGSAAANQFLTASGTNLSVRHGGCAMLWYDGTSSRWRIIANNA